MYMPEAMPSIADVGGQSRSKHQHALIISLTCECRDKIRSHSASGHYSWVSTLQGAQWQASKFQCTWICSASKSGKSGFQPHLLDVAQALQFVHKTAHPVCSIGLPFLSIAVPSGFWRLCRIAPKRLLATYCLAPVTRIVAATLRAQCRYCYNTFDH